MSLCSDLPSLFMSKSIYIDPDGDMSTGADPVLLKIQQFISDNYLPVKNPQDADLRMSTDEIFSSIKRLHPDVAFSAGDLVRWLTEKGFDFYDAGQMRFEWLLKTAT